MLPGVRGALIIAGASVSTYALTKWIGLADPAFWGIAVALTLIGGVLVEVAAAIRDGRR